MKKRSNKLLCKRSFRTAKVSKKTILLLAAGLILFVLLGFFIPPLGRVTWRTETIRRKGALLAWYNKVEYFIEECSRPPVSLYEVSNFEYQGIPNIKVATALKYDRNQRQKIKREESLLADPNLFFREVEYTLAKAYPHKWFIIELKPGKLYPHRFLIDQDGNVDELRRVEQALHEEK